MQKRTAVIICPSTSTVTEKVLGLTVGERLLLALAHNGYDRVAFLGDGARPSSTRAAIREVPLDQAAAEPQVLLLTADTICDPKLLAEPEALPPSLPLRWVGGAELREITDDVSLKLEALGRGVGGEGSAFALRILGRAERRLAERSLLKSLRKPVDGIVSRHCNRYISLAVSRYLARMELHPNTLTLGFMVFGISAAILAALAQPWWMLVLAGVLFQIQSILDGCDGEVARLTYKFSSSGQWLDSICDDITNWGFFFGLTFGQAHLHGWTWLYVAGGVVFLMQCTMSGLMFYRCYKLGTGDQVKIPDTVSGGEPTTWIARAIHRLRPLTKRDAYIALIALLVVVQLPMVAVVVYALFSVAAFFGVAINEYRLRRMDQSVLERYVANGYRFDLEAKSV